MLPLPAPASGDRDLFFSKSTPYQGTPSELDFTTCISSSYDDYEIRIVDILAATGTAPNWNSLKMQVSTNGGSSYLTTGYEWGSMYIYPNLGTVGVSHNNGDSGFTIFGNGVGVPVGGSITDTGGVNATVMMANPAASEFKEIFYDGSWKSFTTGVNQTIRSSGSGRFLNTTAVNAFRWIFDTGNNFNSGTIRCYGLAN